MSEIKVVGGGAALVKELEALIDWAHDVDLAFAWASSANGRAPHWNALNFGKVRRAIIGVHFNQTEPAALEVMSRFGVLKVVAETSGVFHPKVALGLREGRGRAIIGSSNFTPGGYGANVELNTVIEADLADPAMSAVVRFMEAQWSSTRAFVPNERWLADYAAAWARRPNPPPTPPPPGAGQVATPEDLDVTFPEYFDLVVAQERRTLANGDPIRVFDDAERGSYLQEAEACSAAFAAHSAYAEMPVDDRKRVAGWGDQTSGYFGHMMGAGRFKNLVLEHPEVLGKYLDRIPLTGIVSRLLAGEVLEGLLDADGVALGTASRLLTVKRPDVFLTLNSANRERVRTIFGSAPTTVGGYLSLHDRIWKLPWAKAPRPEGEAEGRVWAARVALLDALLYEIPPYQR